MRRSGAQRADDVFRPQEGSRLQLPSQKRSARAGTPTEDAGWAWGAGLGGARFPGLPGPGPGPAPGSPPHSTNKPK